MNITFGGLDNNQYPSSMNPASAGWRDDTAESGKTLPASSESNPPLKVPPIFRRKAPLPECAPTNRSMSPTPLKKPPQTTAR